METNVTNNHDFRLRSPSAQKNKKDLCTIVKKSYIIFKSSYFSSFFSFNVFFRIKKSF
jgi:hypothetical protein